METDNTTRTILILLIVVIVLQFILIVNLRVDTGDRIDRVETLLNYSKFTAHGSGAYFITDDMTISHVRGIYNSPDHKVYKRIFLNLGLDYICDGEGDNLLNMMS